MGPRCMGLVPPWAEGPQGGQQGEPAPWSRGWRKAISLQEQSQAAGRFGFEDVHALSRRRWEMGGGLGKVSFRSQMWVLRKLGSWG